MTKDEALDKIKKLLALAASPNESEAKLAVAKAQILMTKFNIEKFEQIDQEETKVIRSIYEPPDSLKGTESIYQSLASVANTIAKILGGKAIHVIGQHERIDLWGFPTNLEIIKYTCDCILIQGISDYKEAYKKYRTIGLKPVFWNSFAIAIYDKFGKLKNNEPGLVLYDKVDEAANLAYKLVNMPAISIGSYGEESGRQSGQNAQIRPGIKTNQQGRMIE